MGISSVFGSKLKTAIQLNCELDAVSGDVFEDVLLSPDGSRAVYRADAEFEGRLELYSVATAGGDPVKLNHELAELEDVGKFVMTPDGMTVIYQVGLNWDRPFRGNSSTGDAVLYSVSLAGGTPVQISPSQDERQQRLFMLSPDGNHVLSYGSKRKESSSDDLLVVYRHPIGGGASEELTEGLQIVGSSFGDFSTFLAVSGDGSQIAIRSEGGDVYTVGESGNTAALIAGNTASIFLNNDGSKLIYKGNDEKIYGVDISGGTPVLLSDPQDANPISQYALTSDGEHLVIRVNF